MSMSTKTEIKVVSLKKRFWIHEVLAPAFFLCCVGLMSAVAVKVLISDGTQPQIVAAKEAVHLVSLSRAPAFRANGKKFVVLGLGQDSRTGKQLVWIKSVATNKVKGYREGDSLFGSAVTVASIESNRVQINNLGVKIPVTLAQ